MGWFDYNDVGIDLGTASVLVYVKGKGIVMREPSVVAVERQSGKMMAIGEEARIMLGRTPGNIVAVRPLRDGVISNFHDTERMLRYFLRKVIGRKLFFKPRVVVCVPSGVTEVEKRSVIEATEEAGARNTCLIEEPIAAAIGAGIDIGEPVGHMVLDIGGGTTDIAVISLGGAVLSDSIKIAGDKFDEAMVRYVKKKYNMLIGERCGFGKRCSFGEWCSFCKVCSFEGGRVSGGRYVAVDRIGGEKRKAYFFADKDGNIFVRAGCWFSDLSAFKERVRDVHAGTRHEKEYLAACDLAELMLMEEERCS